MFMKIFCMFEVYLNQCEFFENNVGGFNYFVEDGKQSNKEKG